VLFCLIALLSQLPAVAQSAIGKTAGEAAVQSSTDDASLQAANGAKPGQPTAPTPETAKKLFSLPTPFPPGLIRGIDTTTQSRAILTHLGEVVRYYRMAVAPIQKGW
jgi:hypothetical protein